MSISSSTFRRFASTLSTLSRSFQVPIQIPQLLSPSAMPFVWGSQPDHRRRRVLNAVLMRSGTSKGLFIHRDQLPASEAEWSPIILSAMGSASGDKRQLDGVGGATSTTSKVAVVSKSKCPDVDVDYTFAQVAVGDKKIDMTGNCGNIASGVGPFALDEGIVTAKPGQTEVSTTSRFHLISDRLVHKNLCLSARYSSF